ncbi:elongin C, partial [Mycosarcoma maydis]
TETSDSAPTRWVTLVSDDGYRFLVDNTTVMASPTIKTMLSMGEGGGFAEAESNTARLQIRGEVLEKVIEYLHFKTKYSGATNVDVPDFRNRIPPEIALELLMAADFLEL